MQSQQFHQNLHLTHAPERIRVVALQRPKYSLLQNAFANGLQW